MKRINAPFVTNWIAPAHHLRWCSVPQLQLLVRELMCPLPQRTPPEVVSSWAFAHYFNCSSRPLSGVSGVKAPLETKPAWFGLIYWKTLPPISISDSIQWFLISPMALIVGIGTLFFFNFLALPMHVCTHLTSSVVGFSGDCGRDFVFTVSGWVRDSLCMVTLVLCQHCLSLHLCFVCLIYGVGFSL